MPFDSQIVLSNANAGLLYLLAMTSLGIYGIILAGWRPTRSMRSWVRCAPSAQMISYEIAMGFALVGVMIASGSLNLSNIVMAQAGSSGFFDWFLLPLFPLFVIYWVSGVAETNRAPFDVVEGESEIVAGHMVEYSGGAFALFFLAEYANMILISFLISIFFLGGWLSPVHGLGQLRRCLAAGRLDLEGGRAVAVRQGVSSSPVPTSGSVPASRASATTRSCAWAGRSSSRWPFCDRGYRRHGVLRRDSKGRLKYEQGLPITSRACCCSNCWRASG